MWYVVRIILLLCLFVELMDLGSDLYLVLLSSLIVILGSSEVAYSLELLAVWYHVRS